LEVEYLEEGLQAELREEKLPEEEEEERRRRRAGKG
jgi:hypothetical protein